MDVYWFEQSLNDVPECDDWLSHPEGMRLGTLRFPKRHAEWRLGRWTAKCAVALYQHLPIEPGVLSEIEICATPSGAPAVLMPGLSHPMPISISHRSGRAACALSSAEARLGCDLELIEPRDDSFLSDYFTRFEQDLVAQAPPADRSEILSLLWSAKESALKALKEGLRLDTRSLTVYVEPTSAAHWRTLHVASSGGDFFQGWCRRTEAMVQTLVADMPCAPPITLVSPATCAARPLS